MQTNNIFRHLILFVSGTHGNYNADHIGRVGANVLFSGQPTIYGADMEDEDEMLWKDVPTADETSIYSICITVRIWGTKTECYGRMFLPLTRAISILFVLRCGYGIRGRNVMEGRSHR